MLPDIKIIFCIDMTSSKKFNYNTIHLVTYFIVYLMFVFVSMVVGPNTIRDAKLLLSSVTFTSTVGRFPAFNDEVLARNSVLGPDLVG